MGRRGRFTQADARAVVALFILAVAMMVLAAVGLYLLIAAAVVAAGWLLKRGIEAYERHRAERERVERVRQASPAFASFATDGGVATSGALLDAAPGAFNAWIGTFPFAPSDARPLIRDVSYREHRFARASTAYETRVVVERSGRCSGMHDRQVRCRPGDFDAWSIGDDELRRRSVHMAACDDCSGAGRRTCSTCSGNGRTPCGACNGAGKAYGYAKNNSYRLLNCKACRGSGSHDCTCVAGRVVCRGCEGSGRVDRWLAVERTRRVEVRCDRVALDARAFPWLQQSAADDVVLRDAMIVATLSSPRALAYSEALQVASQHGIDAAILVAPAQRTGDRVQRLDVEVIAIPEVAVAYEMNLRPESVSFFGRRMLAPTPEHAGDRLPVRRARFLRNVLRGVVAVPVAAALFYLFRGAYFWNAQTAMLLATLLLGCAVAFGTAWAGSLGRRPASAWGAMALLAFLSSGALAMAVEPSLDDAREGLARGDLDMARAELLALGTEKPEAAEAWADLMLAVTRTMTAPADAATAAAAVPATSPQRRLADAHVDSLVAATVEAALAAGHSTRAALAMQSASPAFASDPRQRATAATLYERRTADCLARDDWSCAASEARLADSFGSTAALKKVGSSLYDQALAATRRGLSAKSRTTRSEAALAAGRLWGQWQSVSGSDPPRSYASLQEVYARDVESARVEAAARERAEERRAASREERRRERESDETTVYVTNTGSKYHHGGCRYLRSSSRAISLSAARQAYSACSVCF